LVKVKASSSCTIFSSFTSWSSSSSPKGFKLLS
jgi:hypothetical protein